LEEGRVVGAGREELKDTGEGGAGVRGEALVFVWVGEGKGLRVEMWLVDKVP